MGTQTTPPPQPVPPSQTMSTLTVAVSGTGTVTSNPAGINCPSTCTASLPQNTQVTLTESAGPNEAFSGWTGPCTGTGTCNLTLATSSSVTASFSNLGMKGLNHIVFLVQENRSFDEYFGAMRQYWAKNGIPDQAFDGLPQFNPPANPALAPAIPGCDPNQPFPAACVADPSVTVTSFHSASVCNEEPSPFWNEAHVSWDYADPTGINPAALNGFVQISANDARQVTPPLNDLNGLRAMGYFDDTDLNFYYFMASNFATSDRWFSPVMDRTQLNRMYLLGGTSAGHAYPLAPPYGPLPNTTIFEELQNAGITWKIYVNPLNTGCADTDSACLGQFTAVGMFTYGQTINSTPTLLQNIVPISQFTTDAQNGTLPQVALIAPSGPGALDEHPNDTDTGALSNIQLGAQYAEGLINTLMTSPSWKDSAMILTYDEAGGFYDHVSPQPMPSPDGVQPFDLQPGDICSGPGEIGTGTCDFTWTGYRLPLILISPFAKKNFVSHTVRDYTAILNLIEERFGVAALTQRDAAQVPMDEFFDFVNVPWSTPPAPPAQLTTAACTLAAPTP
jgi:phospholipase C